jgi:hypothetical protein
MGSHDAVSPSGAVTVSRSKSLFSRPRLANACRPPQRSYSQGLSGSLSHSTLGDPLRKNAQRPATKTPA